MKYLTIFAFFTVMNMYFAKETAVYRASGGDLFDLIRGIPPKEGALKLTKAEGPDRANLPDGIYYEPAEDEVLIVKDSPYLYIKGRKENFEGNKE